MPKSILKEYAVEPEAFETERDVRDAMNAFSFFEGRLIAEMPPDWTNAVLKHLRNLQLPSPRDAAAVRYLEKLKRQGVVSSIHAYRTGNASWADNVLDAISAESLDGGIARRLGDERLPDIDEFFSDYRSVHSGPFTTDLTHYRLACHRLIELGPRVVLVDPYFALHQKDADRARLLRDFISIGQRGKCKHFDIFVSKLHCLDPINKALFNSNAEKALRAADHPGLEVTITVLDPPTNWMREHERFLLTERGGIDMRVGFELRKVARKSVVSVVTQELHEDLCRKFLDNKHGLGVEYKVLWSDGVLSVVSGGH